MVIIVHLASCLKTHKHHLENNLKLLIAVEFDLNMSLYTLFFIRTSKNQLRLWMFLGYWNISIFNVLKIFCKNKAKSSYVLNFYQFLGLLFFQMFLEIHTRNRGHSWSNKESFWGTWSKISLRINLYCHIPHIIGS